MVSPRTSAATSGHLTQLHNNHQNFHRQLLPTISGRQPTTIADNQQTTADNQQKISNQQQTMTKTTCNEQPSPGSGQHDNQQTKQRHSTAFYTIINRQPTSDTRNNQLATLKARHQRPNITADIWHIEISNPF